MVACVFNNRIDTRRVGGIRARVRMRVNMLFMAAVVLLAVAALAQVAAGAARGMEGHRRSAVAARP